MKLTAGQLEQLQNVVYYGPVWAGDMLAIDLKTQLLRFGLIAYLSGNNKAGARDGIRIGGYVATDLGRQVYFESTGKGILS